ncbi:hypothetical protein SSX86_003853 [Deinandra increscens subsp. villosa]|uniref:GBF-interacting protein 1 N-terminal domain-containing protein n=1 Tax=Deinandra increscens subsp. villosa TaxID=3103831 RepID=A0AAP0DIG3_9ASTR
MSGGRVSIPNNVRKTIQNLKEITGNHSEDEIYAMLKDCSMDPNETAQKLLSQDQFHEVKRKRDRKKENLNKESTELRWKPGMQARGNRGGRSNYPSRHISNNAGGGRTSLSAKENGIGKEGAIFTNYLAYFFSATLPNKMNVSFGSNSEEKILTLFSSSRALPDRIAVNTSIVTAAHSSAGSDKKSEAGPTVGVRSGSEDGPLMSSSNVTQESSIPGVYLSDSDSILVPSHDSQLPLGKSQPNPEQIHETPLENKSTASGPKVGQSSMQGKAPVTHVSFPVTRPSSSYNNRLQQAIGTQKAGPSMEWKPKQTNATLSQGTGSIESVKVPTVLVESQTSISSAAHNSNSKGMAVGLVKKLEESHISDDQHVIIPTHLHVPEAEKLGFCFGSFDASFNATSSNGPNSGTVSDISSEASEVVDESIDEQPGNYSALETADEDHPDRPLSSNNILENPSVVDHVSSNSGPDDHESKQEALLPTRTHEHPIVHTSPNFSFGFIPPMTGTSHRSFETNESQGRDGSQLPNFVVQQPVDPASYYAQVYRSGADVDGRMSPFYSTGVPTKHNGNGVVLSPQDSQSSQEVGNPRVLSGAGPTPVATTQTGVVMQTSIALTQQPLTVFRQPAGVHLPHYPPNYMPYGPYFPPFYVPPQAIHQFLSNSAFPQQPQAGSMFLGHPLASPKYPLSQYKTSSNTGNPINIGMPGSYGSYGLNPAGYNSGPAVTTGNSTSNEELGGSQFKESNVYITGQQSEGSGVWMAAPGRDMSGLQANSFYNIPQGGQVAYTPTQGNHGPFPSIYHHPVQPVTTSAVHPLLQQSQTLAGAGVDMVVPTPQINWPNNY